MPELCARSASLGVLKLGEALRLRFLHAAVFACLVVSCAAQSAPQPPSRAKQPVQKNLPASQLIAPPAPLSPEQVPASPPEVAFNSGMLTIVARNSTLGDILRAVHRQTGAAVDVPGNATDRVVGQFGPGPVRDVLTSLLNGTHFNYVLLGSVNNPNTLDRVVLISRAAGMEESGQQPNAAQYRAPVSTPQSAENAEANTDDAVDITQEPPEQGDDQANQGQAEQPQQPANPGQGGVVKTPEQLLQELQQRQQQLQQQQQPGAPLGFPRNVPPQPPPSQPQ
jgi:hypothetical protein